VTWTRSLRRGRRALYISSPIGLGHAQRDVSIADELRKLHPDLEIDWLAQHPVTAVLERHGMDVISVDSGREAIEVLEENGNIDVALVDVMMPEMDGYATMSELRKLPMLRDKPIIALTAKAMKGDREKCLEAGASDYIAKPVNNAQLLALLKSWVAP
jgi:CheY-like chemotaxis protein